MIPAIGIRRETKDPTQRRAPLSPDHVRELVHRHRIKVLVEPWDQRVFPDREYRHAGAMMSPNLSRCSIVFGVKEPGPEYLIPKKAYCFFSHTIKGQSYNMPLLRAILNRRCTLFDYELVRGDDGKRLLYFGDYAGYAGMIDSLWALGRRLAWEGIDSPFKGVRYARFDQLARRSGGTACPGSSSPLSVDSPEEARWQRELSACLSCFQWWRLTPAT
jgi:saccharopine dehydrogenase (NAD+, L-lysine-forming)